ncbi:MAG TPA: MBL fold metallo-hydrolase [Thermoanaerobaculia bacterium]|jgi:flavorubredoxin|nr:MBL fold metallo-hydrolase [Thermoanaerobaculia bacterium]
MITNTQSGTSIDEIAAGIYRISTPVPPQVIPGGFSFNQYLITGEAPVVFHSGPRAMFPLVREAIENVLPASKLRYIGLSHFESDECGALNEFLAVAPEAVPLCSRTAAMISINDFAARPARALADGEVLSIGDHELEWIDAPHLPHNWETGYLFDRTTKTLFCGDLFTQGGTGDIALTDSDILGPSEAFGRGMVAMMPDYWSHGAGSRKIFERLAVTAPRTLACMHGSAWSGGNGGAAELLMRLADSIGA